MRQLLFIVVFILASVPIGGAAQQRLASSDLSESRIALVIGNANYKDAPLANPMNDARAVAKALNESGFQVKIHTNLTQAQMRRAIREFGDELHAKQGVGLFYFAGHGVQISNRNFLIPVGADIQREYEVEDQAVDAGSVLAMMESAKAPVNIVILDACRNNPFIRNFRSAINGLAPMQAPAGTLVAFSTAPGQTAIDGTGQYSLYTEHLVENLTVPGLKIEDVFKNVRVGVQRVSSGRQVPWENTSLTGDFYFRNKATVEVDDSVRRQTQREEVQRAVKQALAQREGEEAARRKLQQDEIERAVLAALKKREDEATNAQTAARERDTARAAVERLNKELAELRAARDTERTQVERLVAAREADPTVQQATSPQAGPGPAPAEPVLQSTSAAPTQMTASPEGGAKPDAAKPKAKSAPRAPAQIALAAPSSRPKPAVIIGGRVERPDVRAGDQWKYQVTDGFTGLKSMVILEVSEVTNSHVYTYGARRDLSAPDLNLPAAAGQIEVWDRDWNLLRQGGTEYSPFYPSYQFPLEAGKHWSGSVQYQVSHGIAYKQLHGQVAGWERVTVPAGTFDAIKIDLRGIYRVPCVQSSYCISTGAANDTMWYAPTVRQIVKRELRQNDTSRDGYMWQAERWELVEYKSD